MPFYHRLGELPRKRHTAFRDRDGRLYCEEVMGSRGFSGASSTLYHRRPPTSVRSSRLLRDCQVEADPDRSLRMRHFHLQRAPSSESHSLDRLPLLLNNDVRLSLCRPQLTDPHWYRNGQADELLYVSQGRGVLESQMGELPVGTGDYVVVPRGIAHRLRVDKPMMLLVVEASGQIRPPTRYRNDEGQLLEHSPYCERDIRVPESLPDYRQNDPRDEYQLVVKQQDQLTQIELDHHPLDTIGWDGCYYPWALSIHDFEPITGSLHQPPPVHQTFAADGFVVCSFVPRMLDYHPDAVPAPYSHSNVMSDEILFYANDQFVSRSGIGFGSLTVHPAGLPHGPQPGRAEASIGQRRTEELAVMIDTFQPTTIARAVLDLEDPLYAQSWREERTR